MTKYPRHSKKWSWQENGLIFTIPTIPQSQGWARGCPLTQAMFCPLLWRPFKVGGLQCIEFWKKKYEGFSFQKKIHFFHGSFSSSLSFFRKWTKKPTLACPCYSLYDLSPTTQTFDLTVECEYISELISVFLFIHMVWTQFCLEMAVVWIVLLCQFLWRFCFLELRDSILAKNLKRRRRVCQTKKSNRKLY